jgi:starch synthase
MTVPATPVAGAPCRLYFNRAVSDPLRHRPRLQLHTKFNAWELAPANGEDRVDMAPVRDAPSADGCDFWCADVAVPVNAYEISFVASDGEGLFDNNGGQNYSLPVDGPMTKEKWVEEGPERAEAAFLAKQAAEKEAAAAAAAERAAAAAADDERRADEAVAEIKDRAGRWREGAVTELPHMWKAATVSFGPLTLFFSMSSFWGWFCFSALHWVLIVLVKAPT